MNWKTLTKTAKRTLSRNGSKILLGFGIAGAFTAVGFAITATPKAMILLDEKKKELGVEKLDAKTIVKTAAPVYIPTAISMAVSTGCIIGASSVNDRRNAALAAAYTMSETALRSYQDKVAATIGEDKAQEIKEAVTLEKMAKCPEPDEIPTAKNLAPDDVSYDKKVKCWESLSGKYFWTTRNAIEKALNGLNKQLLSDLSVTENDLYDYLGMEHCKNGDLLGWDTQSCMMVDAIGINSKVAERLSGADFDGDTVVAIPISSKVAVKATAALRDLKDFDPKTAYAVPEGNPNGVRLMKKEEKQKEMGIISNLITDMTLRGADEKEIARAVKHSMVVIDAEKHKLDYKRSERESGIQELKKKWQIRVDEDGNEHFGGASTLLSRRKQTVYVPERKGSARIDKETGELIYKESGRRYFDKKKGEFVDAQQKVSLISMTPDARTLSSGTPQENLYADFSNELKALARKARKEAANMKGLVYSPAAAKEYRAEVDSINAKLESVIANKPKERRAMVIANANIKAKIQALDLDPKLDKKEIKKISSVEMQRARDSIGASGSKTRITFTDREWEAVQKGAISDSKLTKILNASKSDEIVKRAMPKTATVITNAKMAKAKAMLANGYTYNEIAKACGVPESTVYSALNK